MSQQDDDIQKSLASPGAGLPVVQAFVLRHIVFPTYCFTTCWDKALAVFQAEGQQVIALVGPRSAEQLQRCVLVKAPMGIEDSSRYSVGLHGTGTSDRSRVEDCRRNRRIDARLNSHG